MSVIQLGLQNGKKVVGVIQLIAECSLEKAGNTSSRFYNPIIKITKSKLFDLIHHA